MTLAGKNTAAGIAEIVGIAETTAAPAAENAAAAAAAKTEKNQLQRGDIKCQ